MPAPIPDKIIKKIAKDIRSWPADIKLTWDAICQAAKLHLDYIPTRQSLSTKSILVFEYKAKKEELIAKTQKAPNRPKNMTVAMQKIQALEKSVASLEYQNSMLHDMLHRMIYNSAQHKISKEELMKALPTPNRTKK